MTQDGCGSLLHIRMTLSFTTPRRFNRRTRRIKMKFTKKVKMLALALGIVCTQSAPAQTFKRVNVQGGAALIQIAPGGASVWALASSGHPYIFKTNKFVLANNIYLCQIAVGGGNTLQA